jgi:uncharacterized RDD family membrane protein YckC
MSDKKDEREYTVTGFHLPSEKQEAKAAPETAKKKKPKKRVVKAGIDPLKQQKSLSLNTKAKPKRRTRSQMAMDETGIRHIKDRAINMYPSHFKRLFAFILDSLFLSFLFGLSTMVSEYTNFFTELATEFGLNSFSDLLPVPIEDIAIFIILYFTTYISAIAIWSCSPGKNILGLVIVKPGAKSVGYFTAIWRELIFKNITIISIIGLFPIFFTKDRKALHDYLAGTYVTKLH